MTQRRDNNDQPRPNSINPCAMNATLPTESGAACSEPNCSKANCPDAASVATKPIKRSAFWLHLESLSGDVLIVFLASIGAAWAFRGELILALSVLCLSAIAVVTIGLMALKIADTPSKTQPSSDRKVSTRGLL